MKTALTLQLCHLWHTAWLQLLPRKLTSCDKRWYETLQRKATQDKHKIADRGNAVIVGNISCSQIHQGKKKKKEMYGRYKILKGKTELEDGNSTTENLFHEAKDKLSPIC